MIKIKRNIICFLVVSLMNYIGCYTTNYISLTDLDKIHSSEKVTLVTKDNREYTLANNVAGYPNTQWKIEKDKFYLTTKKLVRGESNSRSQDVVESNDEITFENISSAGVERFDWVKASFLVLGILGVIAIIGASTFELETKNSKPWF